MILQSAIITIILNNLLYLVHSMPSLTEYGGQNCPGSCVQSYSCSTRCAPVNYSTTGASILFDLVTLSFDFLLSEYIFLKNIFLESLR